MNLPLLLKLFCTYLQTSEVDFSFDIAKGINVKAFPDDTKCVSSNGSSKGCAVVPIKLSRGKCFFDFKIKNDVVDNEMTCVGFSLSRQPTNPNYDTSPEVFMYRGYNGEDLVLC